MKVLHRHTCILKHICIWLPSEYNTDGMMASHVEEGVHSIAYNTYVLNVYNQRVIDWQMIIPVHRLCSNNAEVGNWNWFVRSIAPICLIAILCSHTPNVWLWNVWPNVEMVYIDSHLFVCLSFSHKIKLLVFFSIFLWFQVWDKHQFLFE